jgi:hypothetical protein
LVREPAFIQWFGDWQNDPANASKVVDFNGEPLVVYHGTNNQFNVFKAKYNNDGISLIYFTDKKIVAEKYGNVIKNFFLKIENLSEIDVEYKGFNDAYDNTSLEGELRYTEEGLLIKNIYDDPSGKKKGRISNVYAVKYPEQIKLADGSNTTFDGNNPDIRFDGGGVIKDDNGYLSYTINDDEITLDSIKSKSKRKGTATKLINELKEISRVEKKPIGLYAEPQDDSISEEDLIDFYYKNGFELDSSDIDGKLLIWNY